MGRGRAYENTANDYSLMSLASGVARYLGYLPFDAIADGRNTDSVHYADSLPFPANPPMVTITDEETQTYRISLPHPDEVATTAALAVEGYRVSQRYLLQVWAEKKSVLDLLRNTLYIRSADFILASGETSITQTYEFCKKALAANRSARIVYLSDFDPAGNDMPLAVSRRIEWFVHSPQSPLRDEFDEYLDAGNDITLVPLAITRPQKEEHHFPPTMLKAHVQQTRREWGAAHGESGVELNVFDLPRYDGVLARIVRDAVAPFYDADLRQQVAAVAQEAQQFVAERTEELLEPHRERLDELQERYRVIYEAVTPQLTEIRAAIEEELAAVEETLEAEREAVEEVVRDEYPVPEAAESDVDGSAALLWTERSYGEQLLRYKAHLNKPEPGKPRQAHRKRAKE